jgi:tetratricopeptide (TPR) repeat protein
MQKIRSFINSFMERYLSSSKQIQRILILTVIALVLVVGSFASYYYYDRYYSNQSTVSEKTLSQAVQADPTNMDARMALAEAYMLYQRYDEALSQASMVFTSNPDNKRSWLVIGVANANNGHPSEAITPLTNYVDAFKDEEMPGLDKALQTAAYYLGDSYMQMGQPENAIAPLEQTIGWSQTDADAMYKLGLAYSAVNRYAEAISTFHLAINFVPNFTEVYQAMAIAYDASNYPGLGDYARGMVAYSQKDYPAAVELLLKSAQAYPDFAPIFAGLGLTYEAMGDLQNAKTSYDTAVLIDPNNFTASNGAERVAVLLKQ